jgi:hypothetical protein
MPQSELGQEHGQFWGGFRICRGCALVTDGRTEAKNFP